MARRSRGSARRTSARPPRRSLRRLQTDRIDLYYAHQDDPDTPLEETLGAFDALVREGKVRHVAASNFTRRAAARSRWRVSDARRPGAATPRCSRSTTSSSATATRASCAELCAAEGLGCVPYSGAGERLPDRQVPAGRRAVDSARARGARSYLDERGPRVLAALDAVAAAHDAPVAAVALAWLPPSRRSSRRSPARGRPSSSPDLLRVAACSSTPEEPEGLSAVSAASA